MLALIYYECIYDVQCTYYNMLRVYNKDVDKKITILESEDTSIHIFICQHTCSIKVILQTA